MENEIKPPYPWFGGKSRIIETVWTRLGDCPNFIDPFFGGGASMIKRPEGPAIAAGEISRTETVNDLNAWLANFWRAVQADPEAVAYHADWPVSELDLHARGDWLFYRPGVDRDFIERMRSDPDYYDAKSAGWWVWGQSSWIGDSWGRKNCLSRQLPHLGGGAGVNRKLPHLGWGMGVNRKLPHLGDEGRGEGLCKLTRDYLESYMITIADRFRRVRVCCGDWKRVCGSPSTTTYHGLTAVFLDPPYGVEDRADCYGSEDSRTVAVEVRDWCKANGDNKLLRIALCGYDGEHNALEAEGWNVLEWSAHGGYANRSGSQNRYRERVWFSPHCLKPNASAGPLLELIEVGDEH